MDQPTLENERVRLIPVTLDDLDGLWQVSQQNPGLLKYSPSDISTKEKLRVYLQEAIQDRNAYVIYDKNSGSVAGCTSYGNISDHHKRVEIGWTWIGRNHQGTGLNGHVKLLMLKYAFEEAGMQRIEFKIDARNQQSRRAVEKLGAQYEGCLRSHTLMLDGFRRDTVYYSILASEWQSCKHIIKENMK
ncbi:MAG: GNAT family N-acetyltransferase [Saprospiraceae bacterium]|nr:GNAT family N-acetyltransferase [Saprospiraceae bacterium]